jgi:hypothetical protein
MSRHGVSGSFNFFDTIWASKRCYVWNKWLNIPLLQLGRSDSMRGPRSNISVFMWWCGKTHSREWIDKIFFQYSPPPMAIYAAKRDHDSTHIPLMLNAIWFVWCNLRYTQTHGWSPLPVFSLQNSRLLYCPHPRQPWPLPTTSITHYSMLLPSLLLFCVNDRWTLPFCCTKLTLMLWRSLQGVCYGSELNQCTRGFTLLIVF